MNTQTQPRLTPIQRDVVEQLEQGRSVPVNGHGSFDGASQRTLDVLVERGLAEWRDRTGWPAVVRPGTNAAAQRAREAAALVAAQKRADEIARLAADPVAMATALLDLADDINARLHRHANQHHGHR